MRKDRRSDGLSIHLHFVHTRDAGSHDNAAWARAACLFYSRSLCIVLHLSPDSSIFLSNRLSLCFETSRLFLEMSCLFLESSGLFLEMSCLFLEMFVGTSQFCLATRHQALPALWRARVSPLQISLSQPSALRLYLAHRRQKTSCLPPVNSLHNRSKRWDTEFYNLLKIMTFSPDSLLQSSYRRLRPNRRLLSRSTTCG